MKSTRNFHFNLEDQQPAFKWAPGSMTCLNNTRDKELTCPSLECYYGVETRQIDHGRLTQRASGHPIHKQHPPLCQPCSFDLPHFKLLVWKICLHIWPLCDTSPTKQKNTKPPNVDIHPETHLMNSRNNQWDVGQYYLLLSSPHHKEPVLNSSEPLDSHPCFLVQSDYTVALV